MRICGQCGADVEDVDKFCSACGEPLAETDPSGGIDPLVGRTVGGSYVLQEVVGVGGMGRVYIAEQSTLGRTVAVKVIHPHLLGDEQTVARFYQEARAASRLNHPNSVSIIDFGRTDDGILYLVMEYLTGKDLAMIMHETGPLSFDRVCKVLMATLDALGEAHELGIVHRDLKPENIILRTLSSGEDLVKVVDFGLATIVGGESSITKPGLVCGTPDYMSPEQGRGDSVDGRGDLYALGVVLFELLTGQLPFIDDTPTRVVLRHMNDPIPDPRQTAPNRQIPENISVVSMRALAKSPSDRFQTAQQMQAALRAILEQRSSERAGYVSCPNCEASVPASMKFCGECGQRMPFTGLVPGVTRSMRPSFYPPLGSQRRFIGREDELERMRMFRGDVSGGALWVHVRGEPGVGKTRFLTEVAEALSAAGDTVVGAGAHPTGAPVPYYPIRSILAELLGVEVEALADVDDAQLTTPLARAGLSEVIEPGALIGSDGSPRTGAVAETIAAAARNVIKKNGSRAAVLIVDDLPHCDGLTQRTVVELSRACGSDPVLIISAGGDNRGGQTGETLLLGGLDVEQSRVFLGGSGQIDLLARLQEVSNAAGGRVLPLHLEQLEALGISPQDTKVPKLADAIMQRTERLEVDALRLLQSAAVLGWSCELAALRAVSASEDLSGLDQLVEKSLVQIDSDQLDIVHPFISELVEASIPAEARRELHRRAFAATGEAGAPPEVRAEHAFRGAEPMTSLVVLERAGDDSLGRGDHQGAVLAYRRALELVRREILETGDTVLDGALSTFSRKLGDALSRAGDVSGADGVLREALDVAGVHSPSRAKLLLALGHVAARRDRPRDAMRQFGQALELVAGVNPTVESDLQLAIGRIRRVDGSPQHAANAFRRAVELFEDENAAPDVIARARLELAEVLIAAGERDAAVEQLAIVEQEALAIGADALVARAVGTLGTLDELRGQRDEARLQYARASDLAARAGDAPGYRRWLSAGKTLRVSP